MYKGEQTISLAYKAFSKHPLFEDCVFLSMHDPPATYFQGMTDAMLPSIGLVQALDPDFTEGEIKQSNMPASIGFMQLLSHFSGILGKQDQLLEYYGLGEKKANTKRNFGEIASEKDFSDRCLSRKKACAIALLPANTIIDYEKVNFNQHLETLQNLDAAAGTQPMFYSWVNVTCYPEWLKHFNVDPFQIPSVVYYYPEKELQANLIGKFDQETIGAQAEDYLRGRLASWKPSTKASDMKIESRDCQAGFEDSASAGDEQSEADRLMEEEIMREILEEEAARKKEENSKKDNKGTKDKKKKKKGKKGKKKSKKDEL